MADGLEWPHRLRAMRVRRGLTQQELAEQIARIAWTNRDLHVGLTANMVSKWERGQKRPSKLYRDLLCLVLDSDCIELGFHQGQPDIDHPGTEDVNRRDFLRGTTAALGAMTFAGPARAEAPALGRGVELIAPIRRAMLDPHPGGGELSVDRLSRQLQAAWRLRQEGRYAPLARLLPALIIDAHEGARSLTGRDQPRAATILSHAYNAASSALKILGDSHLALLAADRAVDTAKRLDSSVLIAAGFYRLANVFLPIGQAADAAEVATGAAAHLEPQADRSTVELATWGGLTLTAASAHAQTGNSPTAWQLFGEASAAGRRLGHDHADLHTIFGPTSVAMAAVQIAAELGDGREAVRRSTAVSLDALPPALLERRAHYLMNLAHGHALLDDDPAALSHLLTAESVAPDDVHRSNLSRGLVARMLGRERRSATPGLRELADRLGVAA